MTQYDWKHLNTRDVGERFVPCCPKFDFQRDGWALGDSQAQAMK